MKFIPRLLLLLPLLEILGFIFAGAIFGVFPTVLAFITTTLLGVAILRYYKSLSVVKLQQQLRAGWLTPEQMAQSGLVVMAGILLVIPGFITDIIGLLCLIPVLRTAIIKKLQVKGWHNPSSANSSTTRIIEGEARHIDEEK
jgi:UPF0716 protein FxsA